MSGKIYLQLNKLLSICVILPILWSVPVLAQQQQGLCEGHLRDYVRVGDFRSAYACASRVLEIDSQNAEAQLVLARAAQELGQHDVAASFARTARQLPLTRSETYASFLISGLAEANRGNSILAKYYLRRAANVARNQSELALIGRAMNFTRGSSPWSFSISADVNPSTNINGGSLNETLGSGSLNDEAQAQPGIGYSLDLSATHRYLFSDRTLIETQAYSYNSVYSEFGRNNYTLGLKTKLTYVQAAEIPIRWTASVAFDQRFIGDELGGPAFDEYSLYYNQTTVVLERRWQPRTQRVWSAFGSFALRNYDNADRDFSEIYRVGVSYSFPLRSNIGIGISGYLEQTDSVEARYVNKAGGVTIGINWDLYEYPYRLSGKVSFVHTEYEFPELGALEPRLENKVALDLGITPRRLQWFGFRPTFGVELTRNFSNNNRYDTFEATAYTKIQSVF